MLKRIANLSKSLSDKRDYLYKELPNKMKILLISDMEADKSAGAMNVNIGSLSDPEDFPGLAHFCEHMLFMGTDKYPKEDEYSEFLNANSGTYNAYTDLDVTNYFFEISNEAFTEALDRFAQFFTKPLFIADAVEREMKAVDSENKKNLQNDTWRFLQLQRSETSAKSVFNKFSTGNLETLNKPHIRDALLEMHGKLYTSSLMSLVVLSNRSIDELETLVDGLFKEVKVIEGFERPKFNTVMPYDTSNMGYLYKITPVKDSDKLALYWFLDDTTKLYKEKPLNFLSSLIGHEGPNSLCSSLVKDDLISSLVSGMDCIAETYTKFYISLTLTKKGLANYESIIERVLYFIRKIQSQPINKRFYDENKQIAQLKFDFKNKENAMDYTSTLARNFVEYEPEDVLTGAYIYDSLNEELINKYLQSLKVDNLNIYLISKDVDKDTNLTERWYGTKYSKEKFGSDFVSRHCDPKTHHDCSHSLDYPPENVFIPQNLNILSHDKTCQHPEKLVDEEGLVVWYKKDDTFKLPKAMVLCQIYTNKSFRHHTEYETLAYLWNSIVQNELQEISYMAKEANVDFKIHVNNEGLFLSVGGFNYSIYNAIEELVKRFKAITVHDKEEKIKVQQEIHIQEMTNFYYRLPYSQAIAYMEYLMTEPSVTPVEKLEILKKGVNVEKMSHIVQNMLLETRFEWLIQGNILPEEANKIAKLCQELVQNDKLTHDRTAVFRTVKLDPRTNFYLQLPNVNPKEENSVVCSFLQVGNLDNEGICKLLVLESLLKDKFFNELRTKQALGYIAMLFSREYRSNYGLMALVQSTVKPPEYIWARITDFFAEAESQVKDLSDELFKTHINSVITEKKKKDLKLAEEVFRNAEEIKKHKYQFDRREKQIELLENMKKEEFIQFYFDHFVKDIRRLDVEVIADQHVEENKQFEQANNTFCKEKGIKRVCVKSVTDFKRQNTLYPDFHSII
jgi:insulysin